MYENPKLVSVKHCQKKQSFILFYIKDIIILDPKPFRLENKKYNLAATIKANKKLFNFISVVSTYIKTFTFGEKKLQVQIKIIKNCKSKIALKTTVFAILATKFLENGL